MTRIFNAGKKEEEDLFAEPEVNFFPVSYSVPKILPDPSNIIGAIPEDPHSKYTEPTSTLTTDRSHSCALCQPSCQRCGTRDSASRIDPETGMHKPEFANECRRRFESVGTINEL